MPQPISPLARHPQPADPADLAAFLYPDCLHRDSQWEMSHAERHLLRGLMDRLRPRLAVEVGTFRGGSLSIISAYSQNVFALDIDQSIPERLKQFKNTQFLIGPSAQSLPMLLDSLRTKNLWPDFILIDADHSEAGVRGDIQSVLRRQPLKRTYVLMHDSFNPGCRRGIETAGWEQCPYAHFVEVDYTTGCVVNQPGNPANGQMWGGLGLAVLDPKPRAGTLTLDASGRELFERCAAVGAPRPSAPVAAQYEVA